MHGYEIRKVSNVSSECRNIPGLSQFDGQVFLAGVVLRMRMTCPRQESIIETFIWFSDWLPIKYRKTRYRKTDKRWRCNRRYLTIVKSMVSTSTTCSEQQGESRTMKVRPNDWTDDLFAFVYVVCMNKETPCERHPSTIIVGRCRIWTWTCCLPHEPTVLQMSKDIETELIGSYLYFVD